jgi:hypothetical protein
MKNCKESIQKRVYRYSNGVGSNFCCIVTEILKSYCYGLMTISKFVKLLYMLGGEWVSWSLGLKWAYDETRTTG